MKKLKLILLVCFVVSVYSCKKDNVDLVIPVIPHTFDDYSPYKTGNYWVYELFSVDSSGNATSLNTFDSCYISGDTTINGNVYSKLVQPDLVHPPATTLCLRDSLHYIVDQNGQILFSSEDFTSVFSTATITVGSDTVCTIIGKMEDKDMLYNTPAGTFTTSSFVHRYDYTPAWSMNGSVRKQHHRYAKNIGLVSETLVFFASDPYYKERRLIRYHLQ